MNHNILREKLSDKDAQQTPVNPEEHSSRQALSPLRTGTAASFTELRHAFGLLYQTYLASGSIEAHPSGIHYSAFQLLPSARTFVVLSQCQVLNTASLVVDCSAGLPADQSFLQELNNLRQPGKRIAQVFMLANKITAEPLLSKVNAQLIKSIFWWCADNAVDDLCLVINPTTFPFYQRAFGFEQLSEAKSCADQSGREGMLINLDFWRIFGEGRRTTQLIQRFLNERLGTTQPEFDYRLSEKEALGLLSEKPEILIEAKPITLALLQGLYQPAMSGTVTAIHTLDYPLF